MSPLYAYLYRIELPVDDLHHAFDLLGRDRSRSRLLSQQVHDMRGEFVARLVILLQLLVVNVSDLGQLGPVVSVLNGGLVVAAGRGGASVRGSVGTATFLWTCEVYKNA